MTTFFSGEFDAILFEPSGDPELIDATRGIYMNPKPVTELDRLSFVVNQLKNNFAVPKTKLKFTPNQEVIENEAFKGLSKNDTFDLQNWHFKRCPKEKEV